MSSSDLSSDKATDRNRAFPDITSLEFTVTQDPYGYYMHLARRRKDHYTLTSAIPRHLRCLNPLCQQGGLDLHQIVRFWSSGEHTFDCNGQEGTPKGHPKGDPCGNRFEVILSVEHDGGTSAKKP